MADRSTRRWLGGSVLFLACAAPAWGHEFWIEPSTFRAATGQRVSFRLVVGDGFPGEPYPRDPSRIVRFELLGPDGAVELQGRPGADPAGIATVQRPGCHVAVYRNTPSRVELEAAKFESYLAVVGLDHVIDRREEREQTAMPGRELYSRCAKSLVLVGNDTDAGFDRVAGLTLEIVPERNPLRLSPGDELPLRVLYNGEPLAGLLLKAFRKGADGSRTATRTGADGRARLRIAEPGFWMISGVHMIEAPAGKDADWESLWASLTFELAPPS